MKTRNLVISVLVCFVVLAGCSKENPSMPQIPTLEQQDVPRSLIVTEDGCCVGDAMGAKATCSYTGKDHSILAPGFREIGMTICSTHFPAGSDELEAVEGMISHLNSVTGSGVQFYIAGVAPHCDYAATSDEDGVNRIDFVDPDDCTSSDCSFGGRIWRHKNASDEIVEFDVGFNDESTWFFGPPQAWELSDGNTYFRTVLLHELCHGLGFPHVLDATPDLSIMGGKTGKWVGQKHTALKAYDFGHVRFHYPAGPDPRPDLVLANYTSEWSETKANWQCALTEGLSSQVLLPGESSKVSWTHMNRGGDFLRSFATKIYLSSDERLDASDLLLTSLRSSMTGRFPEYETVLKSSKITIPEGTPPGIYYVLLDVDGADRITESNETNNTMALHETLEILEPPPDSDDPLYQALP